MLAIAYIEMNVFAAAMLLLMIISTQYLREKYLFQQRLFMWLVLSVMVMLPLDSMLWALDGIPGQFARMTDIIYTMIYFSISPMPWVIWSMYVHFQIHGNEKKAINAFRVLMIPVYIDAILIILSLYTPLIFYYDNQNIYHRGVLFFTRPLVWTFYLLYTYYELIRYRKKIEPKAIYPLLFFMIPTMIGGLLQFFIYGISFLWPCMVISIQILFMSKQRGQLYTDHLTGINNRRMLDHYLGEITRKEHPKKIIAGIMVDLDSFKAINDIYGHISGDDALIFVADVLRASFGNRDVICRFGGDEFFIIMMCKSEADVKGAIARLNRNIAQNNERKAYPYSISLTSGYAIFDPHIDEDVQAFIRRIDESMYSNKERR